jgi:guanylate kinase
MMHLLNNSACVLSNLDVNGKHSLDTLKIPHTSIFLLPENLDILIKRAQARGGITQEMIDKRIEIAQHEIAQSADYDYQITNYEGKLDQTVAAVAEIIKNHLS